MYLVKILDRESARVICAGGVRFDPSADASKAQAVISISLPRKELLDYPGIRIWWAFEALSHGLYQTALARRLKSELRLSEFLHFAHPDPRFVVPVCTHFEDYIIRKSAERRDNAVAIVSNTGGLWWRLKPGVRLRNRFILDSRVQLLGSAKNWTAFRKWGPFPPAGKPGNYVGELPGWNMCRGTIEKMAGYKVVVCMENTCEPLYFTEKFAQAVQAGAIPVYHAHQSVRDGILKGALWIDPADYGFDPERTLSAALSAPLDQYQDANSKWFLNKAVAETGMNRIWERLAGIVRGLVERPADMNVSDRVADSIRFRRRIF